MLVNYKGWGWFEYEIQSYKYGKEARELASILWKEPEQELDLCIFTLPKFAQIQISQLGETTVSYLLFSEHTYVEPTHGFSGDGKGEIRFYLCDDYPQLDNDCYQLERKQKTVRYTISEVIEKTSNYINSIPELQAINNSNETVKIEDNVIKNSRRIIQKEFLLNLIDKLQLERLKIPVGKKKELKEKCLLQVKIFSSESVFNRVWSELSKSHKISIENKEKFL
jgi:hypothetical protein